MSDIGAHCRMAAPIISGTSETGLIADCLILAAWAQKRSSIIKTDLQPLLAFKPAPDFTLGLGV